MIEKLGKIESVTLGEEDHGIMTCFLMINFGGTCRGFGGYALDNFSKEENRRIGTAAGMDFIMNILKVCNVNDWEELKGKNILVLYETGDLNDKIIGIRGLPFDSNKTFLIKDWQNKFYPKETKNGG